MQDVDADRDTAPLDRLTEPLGLRLVYMIIIGVMLSFAQSVLILLAVIQFVIVLIDNRQPNARLADLGCMVGAWVAKAARYMVGATDTKPWPFREMD
jgi:high-affinity nickel permease